MKIPDLLKYAFAFAAGAYAFAFVLYLRVMDAVEILQKQLTNDYGHQLAEIETRIQDLEKLFPF